MKVKRRRGIEKGRGVDKIDGGGEERGDGGSGNE